MGFKPFQWQKKLCGVVVVVTTRSRSILLMARFQRSTLLSQLTFEILFLRIDRQSCQYIDHIIDLCSILRPFSYNSDSHSNPVRITILSVRFKSRATLFIPNAVLWRLESLIRDFASPLASGLTIKIYCIHILIII
jgi:hypothetical protein